jgi:hypothetical protein
MEISVVYTECQSPYLACHQRRNIYADGESTTKRKIIIMGDKSPKSNQKKSTQKASKANAVNQQKKQNTAASTKPKK